MQKLKNVEYNVKDWSKQCFSNADDKLAKMLKKLTI